MLLWPCPALPDVRGSLGLPCLVLGDCKEQVEGMAGRCAELGHSAGWVLGVIMSWPAPMPVAAPLDTHQLHGGQVGDMGEPWGAGCTIGPPSLPGLVFPQGQAPARKLKDFIDQVGPAARAR